MVLDYETEIEMLLFDMDKIVTYKEINNRFNLTPKEAQNVLNEFIENRRKSKGKKNQFNVIYVLTLQDEEKKAKKITLCSENELDTWKENYTVLSKQVYSIQARAINDFNLIYSNDVDASNNVQRKSNLKLVFNMNEPQQENMAVDPKPTKQENDKVKLSKLSLNDQHNVLKPSKESNVQNSKDKDVEMIDESEVGKDTHVKKEKEIPKVDLEKVKHEPTQPTEDVNSKKIKLESEHHANEPKKAANAKPAPKKATETASKTGSKAANQATLTSFFKKK